MSQARKRLLLERAASMRPSDITDGRPATRGHVGTDLRVRFNEAVGYYRRKSARRSLPMKWWLGFNEAVGYYRRKIASDARSTLVLEKRLASMRPSDITDGRLTSAFPSTLYVAFASMRPSDITDGRLLSISICQTAPRIASMRPSDITDGRTHRTRLSRLRRLRHRLQ